MDNKFKFAAGLPGYGLDGKDGSIGVAGYSIFFTDLSEINMSVQIAANKSLIAATINDMIAGYPIRVYQNDDIIVNETGAVYSIINVGAIDSNKVELVGQLTTEEFIGLITSNIINDATNTPVTYERHANVYDTNRKLVDTVVGGAVNYLNFPTGNIYGVSPINYSTVSYNESSIGAIAPYYLFNTNSTYEKDALALVRDTNTGRWRLGNTDANLFERDTNLILDIHFLQQTTGGVQYDVLTKFHMDASCLFKQSFDTNPNPVAFSFVQDGSKVTTTWNSKLILNVDDDSTVNAKLVVYPLTGRNAKSVIYEKETGTLEDTLSHNRYKINMVERIDSSSYLVVNNLDENIEYGAYIEYDIHGWVRKTSTRTTGTFFKVIKFDGLVNRTLTAISMSGVYAVPIAYNVPWEIISYPSWLEVYPATSALNPTQLDIIVSSQDPNSAERRGSIVLRDTSTGTLITRSFEVIQLSNALPSDVGVYDTGWMNLTLSPTYTVPTNETDAAATLKIRRYGKIVTVTGTIAIASGAPANSTLASISYSLIGGTTTAPTTRIWFGSVATDEDNSSPHRSMRGYVPAYAGQSSLEIKVKDSYQSTPLAINFSYICGDNEYGA